MNMKEKLISFKALYTEAFSTRPKLETKKFKRVYEDLCDIEDFNAGPFYHMYKYGECDYVFRGDHEYFKEIKNCDDFLNWCMDINRIYLERINKAKAINSKEEKDKQLLLTRATKMKRLFHLTVEIQKYRLDNEMLDK